MNRIQKIAVILLAFQQVGAQCPWQKEVPDLQTSCLCAYNLAQELSVQCDQVSFFFAVKIKVFFSECLFKIIFCLG